MAVRTKINFLIRLITLTAGLVIGEGVFASVVEVAAKTLPVIGHEPVVSEVKFDKTEPTVNDKVTAIPTITDMDNDSTEATKYQWKLDGVDISGATQRSYTLVPGDGNGKTLSVVVTPQTDPKITEPAIGATFTSSTITTKGLAPEARDVKIDGTPEVGQVLNGMYDYHDADGSSDLENTSTNGGTSFKWLCSRSSNTQILATTKTYTIKDADVGCTISFNVTPRALSGAPNTGVEAQSNKVTIKKTLESSKIGIFNGNQIGMRSGYGYNMEIDYAHLGYGQPKSISTNEYRKGKGNLHHSKRYYIGGQTGTYSPVTDDGSSIKFGTNAVSSIGDTISIYIVIEFENGNTIGGTSPDIELKG